LGVPLLFTEEFEVVIMIEVVDRRDAWVGLSAWPETWLRASLGWIGTFSTRAKWRSSPSACC